MRLSRGSTAAKKRLGSNRKGDKAAKNKLLLEKGAEAAVKDGDIPLL
jgi:hypothetical protein